ncbi:MAG: hypothetical protein J6S85_03740 [Methanobrevibacter sp.]|nr:hypothetical protein [Methanobrevibacter sp.]
MNENNYGNFEEKEAYRTVRKTDVLLEAIQKCEDLMKELNDACVRIGELTKELQFERDRKEDLSYENRVLRAEIQSLECRG